MQVIPVEKVLDVSSEHSVGYLAWLIYYKRTQSYVIEIIW